MSMDERKFDPLHNKVGTIRASVGDIFQKRQMDIKDKLEKYARKIKDAIEDIEIKDVPDFEDTVNTNFQNMDKIKKEVEKHLDSIISKVDQLKEEGADVVPTDDTSAADRHISQGADRGTEEKIDMVLEQKIEMVLEQAAVNDKGKDFDKLPGQLRKCLMCLSIFPANAEIEKHTLIYWWIGEGFVTPGVEKTAEEVGEECFKSLRELGFIHPVHTRRTDRAVPKCKVNPWVRWMLIFKARDSKMFLFHKKGTPSSSEPPRPCLISKSDYRKQKQQPKKDKKKQSVQSGGEEPQPQSSSEDKRYSSPLSLLNLSERYLNNRIQPFSKMKKTQVVQLGKWQGPKQPDIQVEIPSLLSYLSLPTTLKYLSLRGVLGIKELPDSISKLTNLLILDLKNCVNMEKLNDKIGGLAKLTHFNIEGCFLLRFMPAGFRTLHKLEVLKGFVVGCSNYGNNRGTNRCTVADLVKMVELRKLSIRAAKDAKIEESMWKTVSEMSKLRSLSIKWGSSLIPPPKAPLHLEKLDLRRFIYHPDWNIDPSMFLNLRRLYIRGGTIVRLNYVMTNVEELHLQHLCFLKMTWEDLQSSFPQLTYVEILCCDAILMDMPPKPRNAAGHLITVDKPQRVCNHSEPLPNEVR